MSKGEQVPPQMNRDRETEGTLDLSIKKNRTEYREPVQSKHSPLAPPHSATVYRTAATHTDSSYYHQVPSPQMPSKLSPGLLGHGVSGSILHGTPVSSPSLYTPGQTQPPPSRYEIRQMTPPHAAKEASAGSITQGTPVHQRGIYPASGSNEWNAKRGTVSAQAYYPSRPNAYTVEQRQIIMNDYITSQQMHGTATRRTGDKTSGMYYQPRQGVIQRHNTKPPSPHQYLPGHEALSSLVDVAVRLPSLPVPDIKDSAAEKRLLHEGLGERFNRDNTQDRFSSRDQERFARENHQILHRPMSENHHQQQQIQQQQRDIHQQQIRDHQIHPPIHHHREMERQHREHQYQQLQLQQQHQRDLLHHKQQLRENHLQQYQHQQQQQQRDMDNRLGRLTYPSHREDPSTPQSRMIPFREQNPLPTVRTHADPREGNGSPAGARSGDSSTLTAASLIDAIITHQINQPSEAGPGAPGNTNSNQQQVTRPGDRLFQGFHREGTESNGKLSPLKTTGVSMAGSPDSKQGSLTLGDHIESIINKDYPPTSRHVQYQGFEPQAWKLRRALQHKDLDQNQALREKNDERNIVRMAGPPSPAARGSRYYDSPTVPLSPLDYVKNRIVEVMRTSEEEGGSKSVGEDSPGAGDMVIDEGEESTPQPPAPPFIASSTAYTYPFSALSLNPTAPPVPVSVPNTVTKTPVPIADAIPEPAPLLSAQYEPLSDED